MNPSMHYTALQKLPIPPSGKEGWPWTEGSEPLPERMPDGSEWPKISIVTPSYNQGEFIEETIRSVLLQGYPNLEYIIIDGGSTDNTIEIIKKYEPWITYWVSEKDQGQSHAINKGFEKATGEIMGWLNSDDMHYMNALSNIVRFYKPGPVLWMGKDCVLAEGKIDYHTNCAAILSKQVPIRWEHILFFQVIIPQVSVFWSRELWKKVDQYIANYYLAMDYDLWLRMSKQASVIIPVPEVLGITRVQENAKTVKNGYQAYRAECSMVREKYLRENGINKFSQKVQSLFWSKHYMANKFSWKAWITFNEF
jgi:glycosyltransferase involved in cell wall biosynthesis